MPWVLKWGRMGSHLTGLNGLNMEVIYQYRWASTQVRLDSHTCAKVKLYCI